MADIINIRMELEGMLEAGALASGIENTPENQRDVLTYVIRGLENDLKESSSLTEKLWLGCYIKEANLMKDEL